MRNWTKCAFLAALLLPTPLAGWARYIPHPCKNAFTEQQEITEGQKAAQEVFKQMPILPDSDPVSQYVQQLGARLVQQAPGYKWPYNFHVANVEDINAFALPGGAVFVNLGTIQAAETEAQLAGVMAHEISHVAQRHSTCNITKQQMPSLLAGLGQIAAGIALGGAAGAVVQQGIGLTAGLSFLRMSRDAEKQADLMGTDILYDAGYDPRALPQFF
jgi:predicted Zn-dependent protease